MMLEIVVFVGRRLKACMMAILSSVFHMAAALWKMLQLHKFLKTLCSLCRHGKESVCPSYFGIVDLIGFTEMGFKCDLGL